MSRRRYVSDSQGVRFKLVNVIGRLLHQAHIVVLPWRLRKSGGSAAEVVPGAAAARSRVHDEGRRASPKFELTQLFTVKKRELGSRVIWMLIVR